MTWVSKLRYNSERMRKHYGFDHIDINTREERKKAIGDIRRFYSTNNINMSIITHACLFLSLLENVIFDRIKYAIIWK